jgi:hypothetical protein
MIRSPLRDGGLVCLDSEDRNVSVHSSPVESIERFAELCALLNEGFADRARVLGAAGLDEAAWKRLETRWMTQIAESSNGALARRFGEAYAAKRRPFAEDPSTAAPLTPGPRFLNGEAQPWRNDAATVPLDASGVAPPLLSFVDEDTENAPLPASQPLSAVRDLDQTAELVFGRPGPVLPFSPSRSVEESGVRPAPALRRSDERPRGALDTTDTTVELSMNATRVPALPFQSTTRPPGRLHRFDSRTGQPLAIPYWVDDNAVDPNKSA